MAHSQPDPKLLEQYNQLTQRERLLISQAVYELGIGDLAAVARVVHDHPLVERHEEWYTPEACGVYYRLLMVDLGEDASAAKDTLKVAHAPIHLKLARKNWTARVDELRAQIQQKEVEFKRLFHEIEDIRAGKWDDRIIRELREEGKIPPGEGVDVLEDGAEKEAEADVRAVRERREEQGQADEEMLDAAAEAQEREEEVREEDAEEAAEAQSREEADDVEMTEAEPDIDEARQKKEAEEDAEAAEHEQAEEAEGEEQEAVPSPEAPQTAEDLTMDEPEEQEEQEQEQEEEQTERAEAEEEEAEAAEVDENATEPRQSTQPDDHTPAAAEPSPAPEPEAEPEPETRPRRRGLRSRKPTPAPGLFTLGSPATRSHDRVSPYHDDDALLRASHETDAGADRPTTADSDAQPRRRSEREREREKSVKRESTAESMEEAEAEAEPTPPPTRRGRSGRFSKRKVSEADIGSPMEADPEPAPKRRRKRSSSPQLQQHQPSSAKSSPAPTPTPQPASTPSSAAAQKRFQVMILPLLTQIMSHKNGNVFSNPVTEHDAPGYNEIVRRPMNLKTIKARIRDGQITTSGEFRRDVWLMFANAVMFNPPGSDVAEMAADMMQYAESVINDFLVTEELISINT